MLSAESGSLSRGFFEHSLLQLFLAFDAVARPGHSFEPLRIDLLAAGNALAEISFANAAESAFDHHQQLAVGVALVKQEFLVIRAGGLVGDVLSHVLVRAAAAPDAS